MIDLDIRPITTSQQFAQVETLQNLVQHSPIPVQLMHAIEQNGGLFLGAFQQKTLVGYAFGTIGLISAEGRIDPVAAARLKLYLDHLIVHPDHQNSGIGYELMVNVRLFAVRLGLRLVTGEFDPLNSQQGRLFISKLGGIIRESGNEDSEADSSDWNISAEWWLGNNRVVRRTTQPRKSLKLSAFLDGGGYIVNRTTLNSAEFAVPPATFDEHTGIVVLAEIPTNFAQIAQTDAPLATQWHTHIRKLFAHYLERSYFVTDFVYHTGDVGAERAFYVFTHNSS